MGLTDNKSTLGQVMTCCHLEQDINLSKIEHSQNMQVRSTAVKMYDIWMNRIFKTTELCFNGWMGT